jgi:DNA-binding response OmpR family regulator
MTRILLIDDDEKLGDLLKAYFKRFDLQLDAATLPSVGLAKIQRDKPDLVILDVMLPEQDGFEVCRTIRKTSSVPVVMLTARGEVTDRIVGLEIGADDYLPKTFSTRELLARLRAVTRRATGAARRGDDEGSDPGEHAVGPLRVNSGARAAWLGGQPLSLTPVEFDLLASLARAPGRVKTRELLLEEIRERDYDVFDRSIDVHISALRRKLGDDPRNPRFIRTVRAAGYMMVNPGDPA